MNFVNFRISGQNIDLEGMSKALNIPPTYVCKKGNTNYDKITKQTFTYTEDVWTYDIEIKNEDETEKRMEEFVDLFYKNKEHVRKISKIHDVTLWITIYPDSHQYHLRFSKNVLNKISELGVDFGVTCMQL